MIIFMYIGASPASTGGGIKTTTAYIMIKYFVANFKNRDYVFALKRTIPKEVVKKTTVLIMVSFLWILLATLLVAYYEDNFNTAHKVFRLVDYGFEVVSAFGTVGLSTGITASLSEFSKSVIIATMYLGRTGFLTLISFLAFPITVERYKYPEEDIFVG
jgi:trk system potassium uptake protein